MRDHYALPPEVELLRINDTSGHMPTNLIRTAAIACQARRSRQTDLYFGRNAASLLLVSLTSDAAVAFESHHPPRHRRDRYIEKALLSRPTFRGLICITEKLADQYRTMFPSVASRIIVAPDGADSVASGSSRLVRPRGGRTATVGYVGSLHPGKGAETVLALAQRCPSIEFHIAGGSPSQVEDLAPTITPNVTLHGHLGRNDLEVLYEGLDIALAPYAEDVHVDGDPVNIAPYMSPLKIFEYMAHGTAIICSDLPALHEVLDDEIAVLLPSGDLDAWTRAIVELASDDVRRMGLARNARERLLAHHTWERRAQELIAALA